MVAEFSLLVSIYRQFPDLASKSVDPGDSGAEDKGVGRAVMSSIMVFFRGWRHYFQHKVWPPGLGLAMLYMTVLGFDTITWSYALLQVGVSSAQPLTTSSKYRDNCDYFFHF